MLSGISPCPLVYECNVPSVCSAALTVRAVKWQEGNQGGYRFQL